MKQFLLLVLREEAIQFHISLRHLYVYLCKLVSNTTNRCHSAQAGGSGQFVAIFYSGPFTNYITNHEEAEVATKT